MRAFLNGNRQNPALLGFVIDSIRRNDAEIRIAVLQVVAADEFEIRSDLVRIVDVAALEEREEVHLGGLHQTDELAGRIDLVADEVDLLDAGLGAFVDRVDDVDAPVRQGHRAVADRRGGAAGAAVDVLDALDVGAHAAQHRRPVARNDRRRGARRRGGGHVGAAADAVHDATHGGRGLHLHGLRGERRGDGRRRGGGGRVRLVARGLVGDVHAEELLEAAELALAELAVRRVRGVEDVDDLPREVPRQHLEGDVGLGELAVLVAQHALAHLPRAPQRVDARQQRTTRRKKHLEAPALVLGAHEHLAEHALDALAGRVAEVLAHAEHPRRAALAHLLAHLDLHGALVHEARRRHLAPLALGLLGREAREKVPADLGDARVGPRGTHRALVVAHLGVEEAREVRADHREQPPRVLARHDVLPELVEELLLAALELLLVERLLHRHEGAAERRLELGELALDGAHAVGVEVLELVGEVAPDGALELLEAAHRLRLVVVVLHLPRDGVPRVDALVRPHLAVRKDPVDGLVLEVPHGEAPVPVAVLVGAVEEIDLGEHHEEPVVELDGAVGALHRAEQLELLLHQRRARDVLHEDGDVDLVGEGLLGVTPRLVAGRVDARKIHEHHARHGAAHGDLHRHHAHRTNPGVGAVARARVLQRDERADHLRELVEGARLEGVRRDAEPRLDLREARRDLVELGPRGEVAARGAVVVVDLVARARPVRSAQASELGAVEALPARGAARLERVEVARDALLEFVLRVVLDDGAEGSLGAGLDHRRRPRAALGLGRQQLLALQPRREERALALLLEPYDADLHDALGEAALTVRGALLQVLEAAAEGVELAGAVAAGGEVRTEAVGELPVPRDAVTQELELRGALPPGIGTPHRVASSVGTNGRRGFYHGAAHRFRGTSRAR